MVANSDAGYRANPILSKARKGGPVRQELVSLLSRLVAIDSVNPSLVPGAAGESGIAAFVANELELLGAHVAIVPAEKENRPSVLGVIAGTGGGRSLLLYSHLDTVGVEGFIDPHRPTVRDDKFFGRGSLDMKGGLASVLLAAKAFARARPAGDVYIAAVSDEESDSAGMEAVLHDLGQRQIHPDAAIVPEPTGMDLCLAHRGFAWITITTRGRAAHTALRADGVNAIAHMGRVLTALEEYDRELLERPAHPLLGHGAATVSLVQGGSELYTCPAHCRIDLVRRTLPGENRETIRREFDALLAASGRADPRFSADVRDQSAACAARNPRRIAYRHDAGGHGAKRAGARAGHYRCSLLDGRGVAGGGRHPERDIRPFGRGAARDRRMGEPLERRGADPDSDRDGPSILLLTCSLTRR